MTESEREDEVQRQREEKKKGVKAETCFCADTHKCMDVRTWFVRELLKAQIDTVKKHRSEIV